MSEPKVELTCPLGSKCEEIKDGTLHRCRWFVPLEGENPQTGEYVNKWDCVMGWMPLLQVQANRAGNGVAAAMEDMRNRTVAGQEKTNTLLAYIANPGGWRAKLMALLGGGNQKRLG